MTSTLFWNQPPRRDPTRAVDPLGFDALREAMADKLVPMLTGATRDADEYLWTLVGLRWARKTTNSSIDAEIFSNGFAPFERALKQHWYKFRGRVSGGINVVKKICEEPQPDIRRPILVDQRATGLLGSYIVSLRAMKLVQGDCLRVVDDGADRLLCDVDFSPPRGWCSSWVALKKAFSGIELKAARRRLGVRMFGGDSGEMTRAARSALSRPLAKSWARVAKRELDSEQARLANATTAVIRFETTALAAFGELLRGEKALGGATRKTVRSLAAATRDADPFPSSWKAGNPLRSAIGDALSSLARGWDPVAALLRLHVAVTRDLRQTMPWILHPGEKPAGFQQWRPGSDVPDFRFANLCTLVQQTRWRPHASRGTNIS